MGEDKLLRRPLTTIHSGRTDFQHGLWNIHLKFLFQEGMNWGDHNTMLVVLERIWRPQCVTGIVLVKRSDGMEISVFWVRLATSDFSLTPSSKWFVSKTLHCRRKASSYIYIVKRSGLTTWYLFTRVGCLSNRKKIQKQCPPTFSRRDENRSGVERKGFFGLPGTGRGFSHLVYNDPFHSKSSLLIRESTLAKQALTNSLHAEKKDILSVGFHHCGQRSDESVSGWGKH